MRRQDIIAVLTREEKTALVTNAFRLLCNLKVFDDVKELSAQLKRLLEQLYQDEKDDCFYKSTDGYNSPSNPDFIEYCTAYKQIADIVYFADGKISNGLVQAQLSAWTPTTAVQQKLDIKNNAYRQDYERRQNGTAIQEAVKADIKRREKTFWNSLLQYRHLYLKYQMCKYLNKKFTVPKRFNAKTQPLWKLVEQLKATVANLSDDQQTHVVTATDNVYKAVSQLFYAHDYCSRMSLIVFPTKEDIKEADRQKCLELYDNNNRDCYGWLKQVRFWHEEFIALQEDPDIKNKVLRSRLTNFINVIYTLQCYADKSDSYIKEFLTLLGIVKPKEE